MDESLYKPPRETNEVASTARQRPSVGRFFGFGLVVSRTSDISHDFIFGPPVVLGLVLSVVGYLSPLRRIRS